MCCLLSVGLLDHKICQPSFCRVTIVATERSVRLNETTDTTHLMILLEPMKPVQVSSKSPHTFQILKSRRMLRVMLAVGIVVRESCTHVQVLCVSFHSLLVGRDVSERRRTTTTEQR